jgi:hypothetical protein
MLFVCVIHNNSLGACTAVSSWDEAKIRLKELAENQFQRPLNTEEIESLENEFEIYNDEDADNVYTFSTGVIED